ncbi:carboxypeptidase regulatory-like domain-containing protein [Methanofollis sp. W23]|uniref:carboxypeptidase regulatory-like domain-containing protein n=1 Tax=Methanofollis sp. W23 TaxID=2817849 RepID=UPI001AE0F807|nr:carboxypeptidase regulatory-like domain-containing protein [Methanofollis sp. W23]
MTMTELLIRSTPRRGVDPPLFFGQGSAMHIPPVIVILMVITLPAVCSGLPSEQTAHPEEPINLIVTSPSEGDEGWIDVVPPHVAVVGEVSAPSGIRNVVVQSNTGEVACGNGTTFACSVPVSAGKNTITVIATDNLGNRAEKTLNVTIHIGLPPPPAITVSGRVTDPDNGPIAGASIEFESEFTLDNEPLTVTNTTDQDGRYLIENAPGYRQNITVRKEGYKDLHREIEFENLTNECDLEMEPSGRTVPGFGLHLSILALLGTFLILRSKRK